MPGACRNRRATRGEVVISPAAEQDQKFDWYVKNLLCGTRHLNPINRASIKIKEVKKMKRTILSFLGGALIVSLIWFLAGSLPGLQSKEVSASFVAAEDNSGASPSISMPSDVSLEAYPSPQAIQQGSSSSELVSPQPLVADVEEILFTDLYASVSPSVVHIAVTTHASSGTGSGFVLDTEGHIVTNNHVVEDARRILVSFADGSEVEATIIGTDSDSDIAVLRVNVPASQLQPVELGDSDILQVGQRAIAIGNPYGLEQTMTTGIVSALGRVFRQESGFSLPQLIQTDAAINPGNSGGPLLNSNGQVIGVTTLIYSETGGNSGVGFAVPVNTVKRVIPSLIQTGQYEDPWLGIEGTSITPSMAEELDLPADRGVLVQRTVVGGPSSRAGLRGGSRTIQYEGALLAVDGDIITAVDGVEVQDMDELIIYLLDTTVGQTVRLSVTRGGQEQVIEVTLEARPTE